jgi:hypothetical protein
VTQLSAARQMNRVSTQGWGEETFFHVKTGLDAHPQPPSTVSTGSVFCGGKLQLHESNYSLPTSADVKYAMEPCVYSSTGSGQISIETSLSVYRSEPGW